MPNDVRFGLPISVSFDWLSSRFIAVGLLSIALSSVGQSRFYHPLFADDKNGLLFVSKMVPFLIIILMSQLSKWVLFRK